MQQWTHPLQFVRKSHLRTTTLRPRFGATNEQSDSRNSYLDTHCNQEHLLQIAPK